MPKLIYADVLTSRLKIIFCKECKETFGCICCSVGDYFEEIKDAPTIEAEPVRHGHWINIFDENDPDISTFGRCTKCNEISKRPLGRYCRWCGAKMDEVTP